jgi:predicted nucleotidyltransferase
MNRHITIPTDEIEAFCKRNHICSFGLFGSALREDFGPGSDIDVLVEFEEGKEPDLFKLVELQGELSKMLSRKVDLVECRAVEKSENYIRRRHILESVEQIYVARCRLNAKRNPRSGKNISMVEDAIITAIKNYLVHCLLLAFMPAELCFLVHTSVEKPMSTAT